MANSLKLAVFDCDGILVDSQHEIVAAMHAPYRGHRAPVPPRERLLSLLPTLDRLRRPQGAPAHPPV